MSGIIVVAIIVLLIGTVGLGFGLLQISHEIELLSSDVKDLKAFINGQNLKNIAFDSQIEDSMYHADAIGKDLRKDIDGVAEAVRGIKHELYGTTDVTEFGRLKTQVWSKITPRLEAIERINGLVPNEEYKTVQEGLVTKIVQAEKEEEKNA